jgi:hypothetical protein
MRTIAVEPEEKSSTAGILITLVLFFAAMVAVGAWATMVALGIVGTSVSFAEAAALFCLFRLAILPSQLGKKES